MNRILQYLFPEDISSLPLSAKTRVNLRNWQHHPCSLTDHLSLDTQTRVFRRYVPAAHPCTNDPKYIPLGLSFPHIHRSSRNQWFLVTALYIRKFNTTRNTHSTNTKKLGRESKGGRGMGRGGTQGKGNKRERRTGRAAVDSATIAAGRRIQCTDG